MFHKGLNREIIVETAKKLIEENGIDGFSMRKLADKLEIKAASLYTHIESMETLFTDVGLSALKEQRCCIFNAVVNKHGDEAVKALADSYRRFSFLHPELYQLIMHMPSGDNEVLKEAAAVTAEPFMIVLGDYLLTDERRMHWQRVLRGVMHGFVSQEMSGYFSHYPVSVEESYRLAIQCVIDGLDKEAAQNER